MCHSLHEAGPVTEQVAPCEYGKKLAVNKAERKRREVLPAGVTTAKPLTRHTGACVQRTEAICGSVTSVCWVVETYVDQGVPQVVCMYRTKDDASETV